MVTRIITAVLLLISLSLVYLLYSNVKGPVDQKQFIAQTEQQNVTKMKFIRDVQAMYLSKYGKYCGNWKELVEFAQSGQVPNIQVSEETYLEDGSGEEKVKVKIDTLGLISVRDSLSGQYPNLDISKVNLAAHTNKQFTLYAGVVSNGNLDLNVFEVRDEYPINPERGAQLNEKGEPYSVTTLIEYFKKKSEQVTQEAIMKQREMKGKTGAEEKKLQEELDEISKYINLYSKRIEQLETKPLKVGSRTEATTAGNWE